VLLVGLLMVEAAGATRGGLIGAAGGGLPAASSAQAQDGI